MSFWLPDFFIGIDRGENRQLSSADLYISQAINAFNNARVRLDQKDIFASIPVNLRLCEKLGTNRR